MHIEYIGKNGYTGILYGMSSLSVCDTKTGREIMHSGFCKMRTSAELKEFVDNFDEFISNIGNNSKKEDS